MSEGPELAIFIWNNENLKHTAWLLIRHTETMWDWSQTSNPPPSKVDASECLNVSITYMSTRRNWPITIQSMLSNTERKKCGLASHLFLPFHWLIEIDEYLYEI